MTESAGDSAHDRKIAPEDRIPLFQKFIYGMGSLANDSQAAFIGQMVAILILGLGINPIWVGLIGCVPRLFDAIIDPIVGYSSDNARTRWGRRRSAWRWRRVCWRSDSERAGSRYPRHPTACAPC